MGPDAGYGVAMELLEVIRRPHITEKATALQAQNRYVFVVDPEANKHQVKEAVEGAFKVRVLEVHMVRTPGKMRYMGRFRSYTPETKKAVVTLAPGDKIEFFEGV